MGDLNDLDVDWLIANGRKQKCVPGDTLIQEGIPMEALFIILDGSFSVTIARGNRQLAKLGPGEIAGEISFVDHRAPTATVKALEHSIVLSIPRQQLDLKLKQDTGFAARFYRALAVFLSDRLRRTARQMGYADGKPMPEDKEAEDDLEGSLLDNLHLAGARFNRMLKRLLGG